MTTPLTSEEQEAEAVTVPPTPEEQEAEDAYFADLHREAYDAVAGAYLGPGPADLDEYYATRQSEYDHARGTGFESETYL